MTKLRENLFLAATFLVFLLPLVLLGLYVVTVNDRAQARLAEMEPRYARLLGLEAQKSSLDEALVRVKAVRSQYIHPADQDATQSGNAAQQRVRDIFAGAGLQVLSSQVLPSKVEQGFDRIPLSVRAEGELLALQIALAELSAQTPVVVVNDVDIQVQGGLGNTNPGTPTRLVVQFNLSILRERS